MYVKSIVHTVIPIIAVKRPITTALITIGIRFHKLKPFEFEVLVFILDLLKMESLSSQKSCQHEKLVLIINKSQKLIFLLNLIIPKSFFVVSFDLN
jgi:hypothetical protein